MPIDANYLPDQQLEKRLAKDFYPINANGTAVTEFCKSSGYRIMNGRVEKNNPSKFTCSTTRGNSVVDYALLLEDNFSMFDKMNVGELCELSDHSPIEISMKSSLLINESETQPESLVVSLVNLVTSEDNTYKNSTNSMMLQH